MKPRVGLIAILVGALCLHLYTPAVSAPPGINIADYRGSDEVLVKGPTFEITVRDFFLFAVVTRLLDPEIVPRWQELNENEREVFLENLDLHILLIFNDREAEIERTAQLIDLQSRARRIYAAPAAQLLWADEVVRDEVRVFPEDLVYHYHKNRDEFTEDETILIRRLRVPLSSTANREERDAARARAEALRQQAALEGGLAPLLEDNTELLIDPPGRLIEVTERSEGLDSQIVDAATRLGISQVSEPIRTPGGYMLIEVVDRRIPETRSIEEVSTDIEEALKKKFLPQQFDYLLGKELFDARAINRVTLFLFMPNDADFIRVRDFALTLEEFKNMYPEIIGDPKRPNRAALLATSWDIVTGEVITQVLEDSELLEDPFYQDALAMGDQIFRSSTHLRRLRAEIEPTEEEVLQYLAENREKLEPGRAKVVWRYEIAPREDDENMTQGERDAMRIIMESYLRDLVSTAQRQIDERQRIAESSIAEPEKVVRNLRQPEDRRVRVRFEKEGTVTRQKAAYDVAVPFDRLELGEFTDPVNARDGKVVSYYVSEEVQNTEVSEEELLDTARLRLIIDRSMAMAQGRLEELREAGELEYAPELNAEEFYDSK